MLSDKSRTCVLDACNNLLDKVETRIMSFKKFKAKDVKVLMQFSENVRVRESREIFYDFLCKFKPKEEN